MVESGPLSQKDSGGQGQAPAAMQRPLRGPKVGVDRDKVAKTMNPRWRPDECFYDVFLHTTSCAPLSSEIGGPVAIGARRACNSPLDS